MKKQWPPRPERDFRITSVEWSLAGAKTHRDAGFAPIHQDVLIRRFYQMLHFLQSNGLATRIVAGSVADVRPETELRNSDLTDIGYAFAQRYVDRWAERAHKDAGEVGEAKFLAKWYREFLAAKSDA